MLALRLAAAAGSCKPRRWAEKVCALQLPVRLPRVTAGKLLAGGEDGTVPSLCSHLVIVPRGREAVCEQC